MLRYRIERPKMIISTLRLKIAGALILIVSSLMGLFSYFILGSVPLTALSFSAFILGLICLGISRIVLFEYAIFVRIIISLTIAFVLINAILAFLGNDNISTYFLLNAIGYLILMQIFSDLYPFIRGPLNWINGVIFLSFLSILTVKFIETPK